MILKPNDILQSGDRIHRVDGTSFTAVGAAAGCQVSSALQCDWCAYVSRLDPFPEPAPDWGRAYTLLFEANESHIAELETANTIISAQSEKIDALRRVLKRAQEPVFSSIDLDDDALWDEPV